MLAFCIIQVRQLPVLWLVVTSSSVEAKAQIMQTEAMQLVSLLVSSLCRPVLVTVHFVYGTVPGKIRRLSTFVLVAPVTPTLKRQ